MKLDHDPQELLLLLRRWVYYSRPSSRKRKRRGSNQKKKVRAKVKGEREKRKEKKKEIRATNILGARVGLPATTPPSLCFVVLFILSLLFSDICGCDTRTFSISGIPIRRLALSRVQPANYTQYSVPAAGPKLRMPHSSTQQVNIVATSNDVLSAFLAKQVCIAIDIECQADGRGVTTATAL